MEHTLNVFSIFDSVSGEIGLTPQGTRSRFLRLCGCSLCCDYCDSVETQVWSNGIKMSVEEVFKKLIAKDNYGGRPKHLIITGGEPLLQEKAVQSLIKELKCGWEEGLIYDTISIETNGTILPILYGVDCFIVDLKTPMHEMQDGPEPNPLLLANMGIQPHSMVWYKGLVRDMDDFNYVLDMAEQVKALRRKLMPVNHDNFFRFALSAIYPLHPAGLYSWIYHRDLDAVLNVQIHKCIWPEGEEGDESQEP